MLLGAEYNDEGAAINGIMTVCEHRGTRVTYATGNGSNMRATSAPPPPPSNISNAVFLFAGTVISNGESTLQACLFNNISCADFNFRLLKREFLL